MFKVWVHARERRFHTFILRFPESAVNALAGVSLQLIHTFLLRVAAAARLRPTDNLLLSSSKGCTCETWLAPFPSFST
jgi:hypothetical protein